MDTFTCLPNSKLWVYSIYMYILQLALVPKIFWCRNHTPKLDLIHPTYQYGAAKSLWSRPCLPYPKYAQALVFNHAKVGKLGHTVYMFRAICKFTQFRNCAAQIKNCEIANQFQNCSAKFTQFPNCAVKFTRFRNWVVQIRNSEILKVDVYSNIKQTCTFP